MESSKYLIDKLKVIHDKFNLSIRYKYDVYTEMHIVEIHPLSDYNNNASYINIESELSFEFDNKFFPESVMFVSEESLTKVLNPEFELFPKILIDYAPKESSLNFFSFEIVMESDYKNLYPNNKNLALAA